MECAKIASRLNRLNNLEYYKAYDKERYISDPKRKESNRRYSKTERGRAAHNRGSSAWAKRNVVKRAAHIILNHAVRDGKVTKGKCNKCKAKKVDAHHHDYTKPLDVTWLCHKHHAEEHGPAV